MTTKNLKYTTIATTVLICLFVGYLLVTGCLTSTVKMKSFLDTFGLFAPLMFLMLQIIQVVIPIIPGGVTSAIGVIVFGPVFGFVYNYIGLMIGSIISFVLVKRYGKSFILRFTDQTTYDKYIGWLNKGKNFDMLFAVAIFLPGLPDDLICMISALTDMSLKKFVIINALCKPFMLLINSWGFGNIMLFLQGLIK